MNAMQKILVTGGAGYIGSVLVPMLLQAGHAVTVLDNLQYRQTTLLDCCHYPGFRFVRGDVCNDVLVRSLVDEHETIIPLAALVGAPACQANPSVATMVNYTAVDTILSQVTPAHRILFPTTNSGYGKSEAGAPCTEESPLHPISLYGRLKVEIEQKLLASQQAVSFRLATVFGASPRMRRDLLVNDFTYRALTDRFVVLFEEHFKRNYIHVRDVAGAFLFGLQHYDRMKGQAFNVGLSSANLSKRELCERIARFVPNFYIHAAPVGKDPDQRDYVVSNDKLEGLGWKPHYTIDDGIRELLQAYGVVLENRFTNV